MKEINSYPSIFNIGHPQIRDIFDGPVLIEEKIDGSQFSFSRTNGVLHCRSKGKMLVVDAPEKMFSVGVDIVKNLDLVEGWVYRAEFLGKPKHNTLAYARIPANHIALFDIQTGVETYLTPEEKQSEAVRLGIECVPVLHFGEVSTFDDLKSLLDHESILGGCCIEGFVVKNYAKFTADKKAMMGKFVSEAFKERHSKEWKKTNPGTRDVVGALIASLRTEARWMKAVQHLRDDGALEGSPRDIGKLITEIPNDVLADSGDDIREQLFRHFWPQIRRGIVAGFPEFYKEHLAKEAFHGDGVKHDL